MIFLTNENLHNNEEVANIISNEKQLLNLMIESQGVLKSILLDYMQQLADSTDNVDTQNADTIINILNDFKNSLELLKVNSTKLNELLGIIIMIGCNVLVERKLKIKTSNSHSVNTMLKTGIIVSLGLAIHNFPEGLAIGSGMEASFKLGINLAIAICLHDIPEGISMAVPMKAGGISKTRIIIYVILSGITTGVGALIGALVGKISQAIIGICLSFAAGAMLYIVSGELTPEANNLYRGKFTALGNILGFLLGIIATMN